VIPQAVQRPDRLRPAPSTGESPAPGVAANVAADGNEGVRDPASAAATSAGWSPAPQRATITPAAVAPISTPAADPNLNPGDPGLTPNPNGTIPIESNGNPGVSFNPGWSLPPAAYEEPARGPGVVIPQAGVSRTASSRYGQPVWMLSGKKPTPSAALPTAHPMRPVLIERAASPAPTIIGIPNSAAHGGS
jgi:hypothetical protein